ncbi:MAG: DUF87 domain-containing protein [Candidatus Thermoplasmatota archaeon]|nr:DUF87 domain-containing protein [Candidatus Thermoplasmatota archaeon]
MKENFQKKTLKVVALDDFSPSEFLRRMNKASVGVELAVIADAQTHVFISVSDKSFLRKNVAGEKIELMKSMLDGCGCEEMEFPNLEKPSALIHIVGTPFVAKNQVDVLVSKYLDLGIKACMVARFEPIHSPNLNCPFKTSFSIVLWGSDIETRRNVAVTTSLIGAIYDQNSVYLVMDPNPKKGLKKLLKGKQTYSTFLELKHAIAYFQLPLTYGIEQVKKMKFPMPSGPFTGIELGEPAEFKIGEIDYVRLEVEKLLEHMAVWGASGTGKTTFLKNLLIKIRETGMKFCILDWHNEYRDLAGDQNGKLRDDTIILNPFLGNLSINPLELFETNAPREVLVWERIENFISLMKQMFILGEIQEARLRQSLAMLYTGKNDPNISEAIMVMSDKGMKALTLKLDKFTKDFYGRIFNRSHSSLSFPQLRRRNVIIELDQLPTEVRMFFACVFLILWWDSLRMDDLSPHVLVLDDFYRYADLEVIRKMLSEARKFRQGLICSHQGPYQLPQGIREEVVRNTATKIIFRQEQTWDKLIVRDALGGLTKEQLESLSYLRTGQAIVKIPSVNFPLRVNMPPPPDTKLVLDCRIEETMRRFTGESAPYVNPELEKPIEKKFLEALIQKPNAPLTEVIKTLGIKTRRGYDIKKKLVRDGLLSEEKVRNGPGRPKIVYRPTERGFRYVDREAEKTAPQYGKTEHIIIKDKAASVLRGWKVEVEKGCDVRAENGKVKVAIEVETGKSHDKNQILRNVKRDSKWADRIVIICNDQEAKSDIVEMLGAKTQDIIVLTYTQIDLLPEILKI